MPSVVTELQAHPAQQSGIRFCPPLVVTEAELDTGLRVFEEAVAKSA